MEEIFSDKDTYQKIEKDSFKKQLTQDLFYLSDKRRNVMLMISRIENYLPQMVTYLELMD